MKAIKWIATLLIVIGAINWGLVGAFSFNLVQAIFGMGTLADIIYILVGISGIWGITLLFSSKQNQGSM